MEGKDWAIVFATLVGPILAIQAQKWIELLRERRQRKFWVFQTLMATRASRLSSDHVQALNMIELAFYGRHIFGIRHQSKLERAVVSAWHQYLDSLEPTSEMDWPRRNDLFVSLLSAIAQDVGYVLDRVQLMKSVYSPAGHYQDQDEQVTLRRGLIEIVTGVTPLKVETS